MSIAEQMNTEQLAPLLRVGAKGMTAEQAAVDLLIEHDVWLRRVSFRRVCVRVTRPEDVTPDYPAAAVVDWGAAADAAGGLFEASSSELAVLRVACSLGGAGTVSLDSDLSGLDKANATAVLRALARVLGR